MKARLTPGAYSDIDSAALWCEQQREVLGLQFTERVLEAIDATERNPFEYALVINDARRVLLDQFPYARWFRIEADAIVIACLHHKRDRRLAGERALGVIDNPKPD